MPEICRNPHEEYSNLFFSRFRFQNSKTVRVIVTQSNSNEGRMRI